MAPEGSHRLQPDDDRPADARPGHHQFERAQVERADHPDRAEPYNQHDTRLAPVEEQRVLPAKTSAAAVFALIFGLSGLLAVLTVILAPLGLVLAVIGIILAVIGMKMAKRVGVTGRGVAIGGLVLAVLALILGITLAVGVTTFLNNKSAVDRLDKQVQKLRDNLPAKVDIPSK